MTTVGSIQLRRLAGMVGDATTGLIFGGLSGSTHLNDFKKYEVSGNNVTVTNLTVIGSISTRFQHGMAGDAISGVIMAGNASGGFSRSDFKKYEVIGNNVTVTNLTIIGETLRGPVQAIGDVNSGIIFKEIGGTNPFYTYVVSGNNVTVTNLTGLGNLPQRRQMGMAGDANSGVIFGGQLFSGAFNNLNEFYRYQIGVETTGIEGVLLAPTPRRVNRLPADSTGNAGENVYLTADYTITTGFNLTPEAFAGTTFAGHSAGARGWWRGVETDQEGSYSLGKLTHDDSEIANLRAITDTRVYVARNTLTNLPKIYLGATEYALVRVPQTAGTKIVNVSLSGLPDVDYYTITGGLPAGDWDSVRFETTTAGTFVPADVVVKAGEYTFKDSDWQIVPPRRTDDDINRLIDSKIPRQFRKDADVSGQYFQPSEFWSGTDSQEATITKKVNGLYIVLPSGN